MAIQEVGDIIDVFNPRNDEGFLYLTTAAEHYDPKPGLLQQDRPPKHPENGLLHIGMYSSEKASHRVGLYVPDGYSQ